MTRLAAGRRAAAILVWMILSGPAFESNAAAVDLPVKVEVGVEEKYDDLAIYLVNESTNQTFSDWDWITEPYLTISYTRPGLLPTKLLFDFTADIYAKYPIQDYETFKFLVKQSINDKTAVAVKYTFIPYIFFGDDVIQFGGTNVPYREQQHEINIVQASVDREVTSNLLLTASVKYGARFAQPAFSYRDFRLWGASVEGVYRPLKATRLVLGSACERDEARGGTNAFSGQPDNATYDQISLYTTVSYSISDRWLLKGQYAYRWRNYTTGFGPTYPKGEDLLHFHRRDQTNDYSVQAIYRLTRPVYLYAMYENILKNSTKSYANYHESIYTIGVDYRF
ncbi:MAG TPA: hypothetical protein VEI24_00345 [Nitrospiria bacterium]|nr:hypothetical protein [Nitrospiria bacterium]